MARRQKTNPLDGIREDLRAEDLKPVYLLGGAEQYLVRTVYSSLFKKALGGGPRGFNDQVFLGEKNDAEAIVSGANHLPMMAKRRVLVVRNINRMKAEAQDVLAAYCKSPSPTTVLLLLEDPDTGRGRGKVAALDGRKKLAKAIKSSGRFCQFKKLYGRELRAWIDREARRLGKEMGAGGSELLEAVLGNDLGALHNALHNASLFVGESPRLEREALEEVVSGSRQEALWDFLDSVGERRLGAALHHLQVVFRQGGDPTGTAMAVLGLLKSRIRQLKAAEEARSSGMRPRDALQAAGVQPNLSWKFEPQLGSYGTDELRQASHRLVVAESDIKGGRRMDPRWSLERAVMDTIGLSKGPRA